ncbi:MAG: hypothetical protein V3U65_14900 [Granulosicoccaceae bacterium]
MTKQATTKTFQLAPIFLGCLLSFSASATILDNLVDSNGDGVISADEIIAAKDAQKTETIGQYDVDGDGELSREERAALKADRRAARVAAFDTDGDGEKSRAERRAAHDSRRDAVDALLDVNQDGEVSSEESAGFDEVRENRKESKGKRGHGGKKNGERKGSQG